MSREFLKRLRRGRHAFSIHWKLTSIMMAASALALMLVAIPFVAYEMVAMRRALVRDAMAIARILAENAQASLTFGDAETAADVLRAVAQKGSVDAACLYDQEARAFAVVTREGVRDRFDPPPMRLGRTFGFTASHLYVSMPVETENGSLGTVLLKVSLRDYYGRLRIFFEIFAGSLVLALGVTFLVSARLQNVISGPILALASLAKQVGRARDYSVRAVQRSDDEIGQLVMSFNGMLAEVQARDAELERRVEERTLQLRLEIEERKRAERALLSSEERFRLVALATNDAIWDWDLNDRSIWWNHGLQALFGLSPHEVANCDEWASRVHPGDRERILASLVAACNSADAHWQAEYRFRAAGGEYAYVLDRGHIIRDSAGRALRIVGAMADLTARRRAEENLKRAAEAAEAASRAKSEFLATMSHEIRTPMNGVIGCTNLLYETPLTPEQREYADTIQASGRALLTLLNDILDFSKIEAGRMELERIPFSFAEAIEEVAELLAPQAEAKQLELTIGYEAGGNRRLVGDPGRVRQVLLNLVGNAIKFTSAGHVRIDVAPELVDGRPAFLKCSIIDTGIGIPAEKQALLFQKFSQVDSSTTRRFGGTGLGLAISRRLVELMGGEVGVTSDPASGSTFWFTLPLTEDASPEEPIPHLGHLHDRRLLVVDDHDVNRLVMSRQLRAWGLAHQCASSGPEALGMLRAAVAEGRPFHIALLDHLMPDMDGEALGHIILADPNLRGTVLVMITSGGYRSSASRLIEAGFAAVLTKPVVRPNQLLAVLTKAAAALTPAAAGESGDGAEPEKAGTAEEPRIVRTPSTTALPGAARRILVAEDNAINQRVAVRMLERLGCRVDVAANGREAVEMVRRFPYDLVFMDCLMPEMDGFEAAAMIRRYEQQHANGGRRLPIVALTANAMSGDRERCLEAGMDDHLPKPVMISPLRKILERWIPEKMDDSAKAA